MADQHDDNYIRKGSYNDSFTTALIEQYKMYVQTADNVSARRIATSRYLLTLNVALIAVYGFQLSISSQWYFTFLVPVTGVIVSLLWYMIIKSHHDLNKIKFKLIHELEKNLPAALFTQEYMVGEGSDKSYTKVTDIEKLIPFLFIGIHVILFIAMMWHMGIYRIL
ncbi:MAG: hypothetical protein OXC46_05100 [Thaumarchaeota archaeon]|nr:hypothetical protein [Nitrososphaerota archaeon]